MSYHGVEERRSAAESKHWEASSLLGRAGTPSWNTITFLFNISNTPVNFSMSQRILSYEIAVGLPYSEATYVFCHNAATKSLVTQTNPPRTIMVSKAHFLN